MRFHLTTILVLLPVTLATPAPISSRTSTCALPTAPLSILDFRAFTAALNFPAGVSSVSFSAPSANGSLVLCECSMPAGSNLSAADAHRWITCKGDADLRFWYGGSWLAVREAYLCQGKKVTAQGNATLSVFCYEEADGIFNGTTCLAPTGEMNIPLTQAV